MNAMNQRLRESARKVRIKLRLPLLLSLILLAGTPLFPDPSRDILMLASLESPPPFEGRLTPALGAPIGGTAKEMRSVPRAEHSRRWRAAILALEQEAVRLTPGRSALRLGILRLATGQSDKAIAQLVAAAAYQPLDPDVQNALAVAYLTRALRQGRPFDLVSALAAADRATSAAPASPPIRYNRALILSALHLPNQALAAWKACLELAKDPTTSLTARSFKKRFTAPDLRSRWQERRKSLERLGRPVERVEIESLVAEFPYQARLWAENEILGKWAKAMLQDDQATATADLNLVRLVSAAVSRQRGDRMLANTVALIGTAQQGSPTLHRLIRGHLRFFEGVAAYERQDLAAAESAFEASERLLDAAASPFAGWAKFYRAICLYYSDSGRAISIFKQLDTAFPSNRYPILNGRTHWLLATALGVEGRDQEGLEHNEKALHLLETASGEQEAAFVHTLLAEAYDPLGEVELGWQHRLRGLEVISNSGDHRRIHSMLNEAAQALLRQGFAVQALTVLDELLVNAAAWPEHPIAQAEGLTQRAQTKLALGQIESALDDIRRARTVLARLPTSGLTQSLGIWLDLYEGLSSLPRYPHRAVVLLTGAFKRQNSAGYQWDRPRYLVERARAFLAIGEPERARVDLTEAVSLYEHTRADLQEAALKMRYFRLAQPAFEALMVSDLQHRGGEAMAFVTAERSRARFLLDRRRASLGYEIGEPSFPQPGAFISVLPLDVALVEYAVLPSEVIAWVIEGESWRLVRLNRREDEMKTQVEQLRRDLERGAQESTIQVPAGALFEALIRPLHLGRKTRSLIIVPDRFLLGLPFAVLYDLNDRHYLVEQHAISLYPCSALILDARKKKRRGATVQPALVVGVSTASSGRLALPQAELEARAVGAVYPQAKLLLGPDATRRRFLEELAHAAIIHIAGHTAANAEVPSRSQVFLMPANGDDGTLAAADLWRVDLGRVDLLVLASCESMAGQTDGREALFGIAGGLLAAGVNSVVASLWQVEDRTTADLMVAFHRHYKEEPDAPRAYREAILDLLRADKSHRPNPGSWAAFAVLGGLS
jgi:CHAT domain-containing protein